MIFSFTAKGKREGESSLPLEGRAREGSSSSRREFVTTIRTVLAAVFFATCGAAHAQFPVIQGDFDISPLKSLRINYELRGKLSGNQTLYVAGNRAFVEIDATLPGAADQKLSIQEYYSPEAKIVYDATRKVGRKADNVQYYRKQKLAALSRADRRYYEKHSGAVQTSELRRILGGAGARSDSFLNKKCDVYRRPGMEVYLWKNIVVKMKVPALGIDMEATGIFENPKIPEGLLDPPLGMPISYDEKYSREAKAGVDSLIVAIKKRQLAQPETTKGSGTK